MSSRVLSRVLSQEEIEVLTQSDVPAYLATLDSHGYPRITPLWFVWEDGCFYMTSVGGKFHLRNIERSPLVSICIQVEEIQSGIHRPNQQIKAKGVCDLSSDTDMVYTRKISEKYLTGNFADQEISRRCSIPRVLMQLCPSTIYGFGGGKAQ